MGGDQVADGGHITVRDSLSFVSGGSMTHKIRAMTSLGGSVCSCVCLCVYLRERRGRLEGGETDR